MSAAERIRDDAREAMKAGDRRRSSALRMIQDVLQQDAKLGKGDEIAVLQRERKKRLEHHPDFKEEGRRALKVGPSKGYKIAREMKKPLIRIGFPIHDRLGGARIVHVGYRGAQQLFDTISNTIIASRQDSSPVGYSYM